MDIMDKRVEAGARWLVRNELLFLEVDEATIQAVVDRRWVTRIELAKGVIEAADAILAESEGK